MPANKQARMETPKYSLLENERRFLVESLAEVDLDLENYVQINDLYLPNTNMRLRRAASTDGSVTYKLCKKYPANDYYSVAIVNVYLSLEEYSLFAALPSRKLSKRRYRVLDGDDWLGINVFEGQLAGLVLCEAEMPTREQIYSFQFPMWATTEVTEDVFFTGGHLSQVTSEEFQTKLSSMET